MPTLDVETVLNHTKSPGAALTALLSASEQFLLPVGVDRRLRAALQADHDPARIVSEVVHYLERGPRC